MSVQATFLSAEDAGAWRDAKPFTLGNPPQSPERAAANVGISFGGETRWRVDVCSGAGHSCFREVRCVGELVYIGYGQQVAVLSTKTSNLVSHPLDYFGHLYTALDLEAPELGSSVLVASATELLRFDGAGQLMWRKSALGVDGVLVHRIQGGEIVGDAEWDPPGGWEPFRLRLDSGESIST